MAEPKKLTKEEEQEIADKKEQYENYCKEIESKLRKAERHTWMIKDLDYLEQ
ncbi:MAG: hypothetical protein JEZ08_01140 [Clostridiales bacterium]|nr:hypothetical protein [Clostridiales bacterium]